MRVAGLIIWRLVFVLVVVGFAFTMADEVGGLPVIAATMLGLNAYLLGRVDERDE